ncbi:hypothetical protein J7413_03125 [Shimia sp. R10_1]|uniref:hypothetical protein n=1 Tax=Shimia sp. R10_1 TaxID=2821095 RepID=UPI001ADB0641|nr:hypothetical protein [Shimia sp. R10_1]MBO9472520.1 hypothetical protein [Shimia sp. R10_1]
MTTDLALTLSYQGISLLSRVDGGWHLLGEVALDDEDLPAALTALRDQAVFAGGPEFETTLVLPNDQIKFLSLPLDAAAEGALLGQVQEALEASTPYSADELVFDVYERDGFAQVAAVARETLAEAEGFASEHDFNPVRFTAIPNPADFAQAPNFGATRGAEATGGLTEADPVPIKVIGEGLPEIQPDPPAEPDTRADAVAEPSDEIQTETAEPDPALSAALADENATFDLGEESADTQVAFAFKEPEAPTETDADPHAEDEVAARPTARAEAEAEKETATPFASIRAQRGAGTGDTAPQLSGVSRGVHGTNAPSIPPESQDDATHELRFDPAKAVAGLTADRTEAAPSDARAEQVEGQLTDADSGTFASARNKTKIAGPPPRVAKNDPTFQEKSAAPSERQKGAFGTARAAEVGGKPKHLGLILTTLLLVFLGLVALWATLFTEDGVAGLIDRDTPAESAPIENTAQLDEQPETTEVAVGDGQTDADLAQDAPAVPAPTSEPAPEASHVATTAQEPATDADTDAAAPNGAIALTVPDGLQIEGESTDTQTALLEEIAPEELAESLSGTPEQAAPAVLSQDEAETRYAVTGVWQRAPDAATAPELSNDEDVFVPAIDRLSFALDAVALPSAATYTTDTAFAAQVNPPSATTAFDLDERGLVVATAEGAVNAEGVMVYAGRPPVVPASYPKRIVVAEALQEQAASRLANLRPKPRPSDLLEQNERATLGGLTRAELARIRPRPRPESAQDVASANQAPTALAVSASLRPRLKPANIAQLAARATPSETAPKTTAAAAPAATVIPAIPTTASVARQATIQNAINLKKASLIGIYGTSSNRRALVRLPSGRYKKVQVGDRIDGGKVAAIGESELRYVKSGRNLVLKMPKDG